jgi:hypothetical protein
MVPWELVFAIIPGLILFFYLCGVEGAERKGSLRKGGGESGAPPPVFTFTPHGLT